LLNDVKVSLTMVLSAIAFIKLIFKRRCHKDL